ncbi:hypothetical protein Hypma_001298 [Hypsizygus marmoreus]|uniref:Uncharacterized protein n=1 Tax=Hypsizygus marmoreus TaxID=39966 RepID=A0A369K5W4_HYPMA|nr:hypothetical protein Hypma_001298 [Hypsizygus marmoreus]
MATDSFDWEYPFRHSTYYTRHYEEEDFTSELPPMNSEEDVLQEHLMNHRQYGRNSYLWPGKPNPKKRRGSGRVAIFFNKLKKGLRKALFRRQH